MFCFYLFIISLDVCWFTLLVLFLFTFFLRCTLVYFIYFFTYLLSFLDVRQFPLVFALRVLFFSLFLFNFLDVRWFTWLFFYSSYRLLLLPLVRYYSNLDDINSSIIVIIITVIITLSKIVVKMMTLKDISPYAYNIGNNYYKSKRI